MDDNAVSKVTPQIDDQFLQSMGLTALNVEQKQKVIEDVLHTLNLKVAQRVADNLSESQMDEFERLSENSSQEEISKWLSNNVPNHMQIIEEEAQGLRNRALETVDRVMSKRQLYNTGA